MVLKGRVELTSKEGPYRRAFDLSYPASLNSIDVPIATDEKGKVYR